MPKNFLLLFFLFIPACQDSGSKNDPSSVQGWMLTQTIEDSLLLFSQPASAQQIKDFIDLYGKRTLENEASFSNSDMAHFIHDTAQCYAFDPAFLSAIFMQETAFNENLVSPTGAKGLGQITQAGYLEYKHQTGWDGGSHARPETIAYLNASADLCWQAQVGQPWVNLWEKYSDRKAKQQIHREPRLAIFVTTMHLKVLATVIKNKYPAFSQAEIFHEAAERYNGDVKKKNYADQVLTYTGLVMVQ